MGRKTIEPDGGMVRRGTRRRFLGAAAAALLVVKRLARANDEEWVGVLEGEIYNPDYLYSRGDGSPVGDEFWEIEWAEVLDGEFYDPNRIYQYLDGSPVGDEFWEGEETPWLPVAEGEQFDPDYEYDLTGDPDYDWTWG